MLENRDVPCGMRTATVGDDISPAAQRPESCHTVWLTLTYSLIFYTSVLPLSIILVSSRPSTPPCLETRHPSTTSPPPLCIPELPTEVAAGPTFGCSLFSAAAKSRSPAINSLCSSTRGSFSSYLVVSWNPWAGQRCHTTLQVLTWLYRLDRPAFAPCAPSSLASLPAKRRVGRGLLITTAKQRTLLAPFRVLKPPRNLRVFIGV
ncbi:hypothetical protein FA95DRAFT_321803 [Auriscalpium vulgare]|uniref:Uncharacterized protein n=1 Tax=Auriscalpium vulgare TaxID=40419 RepID=A0ACB8S641_9AGAM|nr:hypothetical protein FA95DRAFT_321803 [Auriscalpium vulgare]